MHAAKLPLHYWFWAAYLVATHSNGMSALQLKKQLQIGSYKSAWLMLNKLRRSMVDPERTKLAGDVEVCLLLSTLKWFGTVRAEQLKQPAGAQSAWTRSMSRPKLMAQ